jgi:hypothetical protein
MKRFALAEWSPSIAARLRLAITTDPDWGAFRTRWAAFPLRDLCKEALQSGILASKDIIDANIENTSGVDIDWDLDRADLVELSDRPILDRMPEEHARLLWDDLCNGLEAGIRRAFRTQRNAGLARGEVYRATRNAMERMTKSVDDLMGEGVAEGFRAALEAMDTARVVIANGA